MQAYVEGQTIVRVVNWPGTKGKRFRFLGYTLADSGPVFKLTEVSRAGETIGHTRFIPGERVRPAT